MKTIEIDLLFKNYGKGKERIILIDKSNNIAILSLGIKDIGYEYLLRKIEEGSFSHSYCECSDPVFLQGVCDKCGGFQD